MKGQMTIAIMVICLGLSQANFLGSYDKLQNTLKSIDNTEFGKNLLDTIALQMDSNSPMADISNLIRDMMNDLRNQQSVADDNLAAKQEECETALNGFQARIDHATNEISESTMAIKSLRGRKRDLNKDIDMGEQMLVMLADEKQRAEEEMAADKLNFFARQEETKQVLEALQVIVPKIKAITPHTASEVFMELAKIGDSNPIAALVQVASSLNPDALAQCIGLLEELMADFAFFLENDVQHQIDQQVDFDNLMIELFEMKTYTEEKLAQDRSELANVEAALAQQETRLSNNEQELEAASAGKDLKTGECVAYYAGYERDSASRSQELEILESVAQIVASRLAGLDDFMGGR